MANYKKDQTAKVAILYYEKNKTQNEIANELNISRSYVSQLLIYARESGIVNISINIDEFSLRMIRKEIEFKSMFPLLQQVYIMDYESEEFTSLNIGKFAAPYIAELINESNIIGINPSLSVEKTVKHLGNQNITFNKKRKVIQIMGGYNSMTHWQPNEIVKELRDVLDCEAYYLNCPAVIDQVSLRDQLIKEESIKDVMNLWKKIDIAVMGLGVADNHSKLFNLFNDLYKEKIFNSNAVGVLNTSYFDEKGNYIPLFENNTIGINIPDLISIPKKVIICTGEYKKKALLGALRGGLIDILITDSLTVNAVEEALKVMNVQESKCS